MHGRSTLAATLFAVTSLATPITLDAFSNAIETKLAGVSSNLKSLVLPQTQSKPYAGTGACKVYPGDADWPADSAWDALNKAVDGRLLAYPTPYASVCYAGPTYDANKCANITANWYISYSKLEDPIEYMLPMVQGLSCVAPSIYDSGNCTRGGYPAYVINATKPEHVQAGVNFARNTGVRLVIKNTGHDFLGKSAGKDSLSIWVHHFKDVEYVPEYDDAAVNYKGPAFKSGVGVQAYEIFKQANDLNHTVVGGEGQTVGIMGGYIQGGGHSPLSSLYGMGADQVLSFDVVLSTGEMVVANSTSNTDLFWAMRGGGGSTFGVATSVTVKAHPDTVTTVSHFNFTSAKCGADNFWKGYRAYLNYHEQFADAGTYAYYVVYNTSGVYTLKMTPFFAPGYTAAQTTAMLQPWLDELAALGITFDPQIQEYSNYYDAWWNGFPLETVGKINVTTASRFFQRPNFATDAKKDELAKTLKGTSDAGHAMVFFNMKNVDPANADNAVNPAWRTSVLFAQQGIYWNALDPEPVRMQARLDWQKNNVQPWRDITPGSGGYLNEADVLEPNYQQAFWGSHYPRLQTLKTKFDPLDVFFAVTAVGSERWEVKSVDGFPTENGKLCRVQS